MTVLNILCYPDERLRNKAKPVSEVNDETRQLVADLFETMYQAPGIGLAATQVDVHQQVIVIDISENKDEGLVLINPQIVTAEGHEKMEEGCLSVPGVYEQVERAEHITITSLDLEGNKFEFNAKGILAVCIQHEMDHLQGKLFVDYLSEMKRQRIKKKIQKQHKQDHLVL